MDEPRSIRRYDLSTDHEGGREESFPSPVSDAIPPAVQRCLNSFGHLVEHATEDGPEWATNQEARLRAWASSLDVFAKYELSIRYRLRVNNTIATVILQILEGVEGCLSLLLKHSARPMSILAFKSGKVEVLQRELRQAISRLVEIATYLRAAATQKEDDKALAYDPSDVVGIPLLPKHAVYVREQMDMHLRNNRDRYSCAREGPQGTAAPIDLRNGIEKWLRLSENGRRNATICSDFLTERLFQTIMQRWRLLCYRQRRAQVIGEYVDEGIPEFAVVSNTPKTSKSGKHLPLSVLRAMDTVANRFHLPSGTGVGHPPRLFAAPTLSEGRTLPKAEVPMASQTKSVATGMTKAALTDLEFPTPPHVANSGEALCPLCTILMPVKYFKGREWRTHVLRDIGPYICVFEECSNPSARFTSTRLWKQHMSEQHSQERWFCQDCSCSINYTSGSTNPDVTAHIRGHDATISDSEIQLIARHTSSRQPARLSVCAFCHGCGALESETPDKHWDRLTAHMVDDHMIPLSMLSLPFDADTQNDADRPISRISRPVGEADDSTQYMPNSVSLAFSDAMSEQPATRGVNPDLQGLQSLHLDKGTKNSVVDWLGDLAKASSSMQSTWIKGQEPTGTSDPLTTPGTAVSLPLPTGDAIVGDSSKSPATGEDINSGAIMFEKPDNISTPHVPERARSPWHVYNLLTLDGGGVRGYWTLLVLQRLMEFIAVQEESFDDALLEQWPAYQSFDPHQYPSHCCHIPRTYEERRIPANVDHSDKDHDIRNLASAKRFLPCHYFDYIGGTSTGGVIAIMLGRLRMTVADCIEEFKMICVEVFGKPHKVHQLVFPLVKQPKFDHLRLRAVFNDIVERRAEDLFGGVSLNDRLPSRTMVCQTFVTSYATFSNDPNDAREYVLRSYSYADRSPPGKQIHLEAPIQRSRQKVQTLRSHPPHEKISRRTINAGPPADINIPDALRATMAAPFYFEPVTIKLNDRKDVLFEDGGFGSTTNPTIVGIEEIQCMHGPDSIGTVVSVGTARGQKAESKERLFKERLLKEPIQNRLKRVINMARDLDGVHRRAMAITLNHRVEYFRLDPRQDKFRLAIPIDEWLPRSKKQYGLLRKATKLYPGQRTMEEIDKAFQHWALDYDTQADMMRCAEALVDCRRARTKDAARWERYALGSGFRCQLSQVHAKCDYDFIYRNAFEDHLRTYHGFVSTESIRREANAVMSRFRYQASRGK